MNYLVSPVKKRVQTSYSWRTFLFQLDLSKQWQDVSQSSNPDVYEGFVHCRPPSLWREKVPLSLKLKYLNMYVLIYPSGICRIALVQTGTMSVSLSSLVSLGAYSNKHSCGYCGGNDTSHSFGFYAPLMSVETYEALLNRGWRRWQPTFVHLIFQVLIE